MLIRLLSGTPPEVCTVTKHPHCPSPIHSKTKSCWNLPHHPKQAEWGDHQQETVSLMPCKEHEIKINKIYALEHRFVSVQEEDDVPEDRGPVQDLRELERLDQVHDAGDHAQRDCHVGTNTHTHTCKYCQRCTDIQIWVMCCVSRAMMMTACDLSAIAKPWEVQSKVHPCVISTQGPFHTSQ